PEAPPLASRAAPLCRWRPWQYNTATRRDASTTVWEGCQMSVNVAPGALMLYVLSAVLLTIPVSLLLVWRYRRSVQKTMRRASLAGDTISQEAAFPEAGKQPPAGEITEIERSHRRRLAVIYGAAGGIGALIWTVIYFQSPDLDFLPLRAFVVWYTFGWPIVPTLRP